MPIAIGESICKICHFGVAPTCRLGTTNNDKKDMSYLDYCRRTLLMQGAHGKRIEEQLLHISQITLLSINPNPAVKGSVR